MIIKPPKPGLGFGFWHLAFWDLVWLGYGNKLQEVNKIIFYVVSHTEGVSKKVLIIFQIKSTTFIDTFSHFIYRVSHKE